MTQQSMRVRKKAEARSTRGLRIEYVKSCPSPLWPPADRCACRTLHKDIGMTRIHGTESWQAEYHRILHSIWLHASKCLRRSVTALLIFVLTCCIILKTTNIFVRTLDHSYPQSNAIVVVAALHRGFVQLSHGLQAFAAHVRTPLSRKGKALDWHGLH